MYYNVVGRRLSAPNSHGERHGLGPRSSVNAYPSACNDLHHGDDNYSLGEALHHGEHAVCGSRSCVCSVLARGVSAKSLTLIAIRAAITSSVLSSRSFQIPEGKKAMEYGLAATMPVMSSVKLQTLISVQRTSEVGNHTWYLRDMEGMAFIRERWGSREGGAASSAAPAPAPVALVAKKAPALAPAMPLAPKVGENVKAKAQAAVVDVKPVFPVPAEKAVPASTAGDKRLRASGAPLAFDLTGACESAGEPGCMGSA